MAARDPSAVQADLQGTGNQSYHGEPALAVRHRGHRLAVERQGRFGEEIMSSQLRANDASTGHRSSKATE